ncbi:MAG: RNA methyltransferase [Caldiserica bacterium]|jgi:hypothetical protein|nr:RNA methyltransferase [Caldisericota bacterium]MDH7562896.1 RNA methyltransferase [Caldisericota bacterium]
MNKLALALVHYPIYDRCGGISVTNITNFDIHDIARLARTYDLFSYYIVHPYESQRKIALRIIEYWTGGKGSQINPDRKEALKLVKVVETLQQAKDDLELAFGLPPFSVYTDARTVKPFLSYSQLKRKILVSKRPGLLVLGTGWGISREEIEKGDFFLEPIAHTSDYNHLSVRTACAIMLDRIFRLK